MAFPNPVIERITADIVDTLKSVRKANSYAHDLTVQRIGRNGNAPQAGQILAVVIQGNPQAVPEQSHDQTAWDQPYAIDCYIDPAEDLETPLDKAINLLRADVEKALTFGEPSRTRGGLAEGTKLDAPVLFQRPTAAGTQFGVQVRIRVRYATAWNDPYVSAYSSNEP